MSKWGTPGLGLPGAGLEERGAGVGGCDAQRPPKKSLRESSLQNAYPCSRPSYRGTSNPPSHKEIINKLVERVATVVGAKSGIGVTAARALVAESGRVL